MSRRTRLSTSPYSCSVLDRLWILLRRKFRTVYLCERYLTLLLVRVCSNETIPVTVNGTTVVLVYTIISCGIRVNVDSRWANPERMCTVDPNSYILIPSANNLLLLKRCTGYESSLPTCSTAVTGSSLASQLLRLFGQKTLCDWQQTK